MTIFMGPNAVGKTNIVEGIQVMTAIESFRHPQIRHLIKEGHDQGMISANLQDGKRNVDVELLLFEGKRRYLFNGKPKKSSDLKSLCPSVAFCPDDLNLVKGSDAPRRQALDSLISQLSGNHQIICRDYGNVIKHKNALLKDGANDVLLRSINEMVISCGAQLIGYRLRLFKKLKDYIALRYESIVVARETLSCDYHPTWTEEENLFSLSVDEIKMMISQKLEDVFEEEKRRGRSLVGPHRDGISYSVDGKDATVYASQGQQRSIVLAQKLSEVALIQDILGQQPILLLDDVMSELDEQRRQTLVRFMEESMQVFITTTNLAYFDSSMLKNADVITLPLTVDAF